MSSFDSYVRRVFSATLFLILVLAGLFLVIGHSSWARGIALGGAASLVNLVIMAGDVRRQGQSLERLPVGPSRGRYAMRMTILAATLIYASINPAIALWAVIPTLFAAQAAMVCGELLTGRKQGTS